MATATLFDIGEELGVNTLEPRDYQQEGINAARATLAKERATCMVWPTGCHDPDQPILMYDGTVKAARDVVLGDELMGSDSTPRTVLVLHRGRKPMARIYPIKGDSFVVTMDHPLSLVRTSESSRPDRPSRNRDGEIVDVTVSEWLAWPKFRKHIHKLFRVAVDFPDSGPPEFHPYLLGVLLGDGSIKYGSIGVTTKDPEIVKFMESIAEGMAPSGYKLRVEVNGGRCPVYYLAQNSKCGRRGGVIIRQLKGIGVWGMGAGEKFIPQSIKTGDRETRRQVLAGLMDTDGSLSTSTFDYISKSETLSRDVAFIARSLGLAAYVTPCEKSCQTGYRGIYWRVSISGNVDIIPCRIARKQAGKRRQKKDVLRTGFTVEPIGEGDYVGFTVDGDNRYVMGDFTVTHNSGKTVGFASIARKCAEKGGRTMILAHRRELITQAAATVERVGILPGIEMGDARARAMHEPWVVIASKDSLHPKRLQEWSPDHFRLIIVDEAHHATSSTYQRVFQYFKSAKLLGVTATPDRADEDKILDVFGSICHERNIWDLMTSPPPGPWLCRLKFVQCDVQIDLRQIRTTGGDFNAADLEAAIKPLIEILANAARQEIGERQTLVFTPDVGSAMAMASAMQSLGLKADWIAGDDPDRDAKLKDYRAGEIQVLCNAMLLTEGVDLPSTGAIVLCRPTKSRILYNQIIGRGTRLKKGLPWDDCLVVDFAYLTGKMDLCRPADLFDRSDKDDEENEIIEELLRAGGEKQLDLIDVVAKAATEHRERQQLRIKAQAREVKYRRIAYDPLSVADSLGVTMRQGTSAVHDPATPKQVETLEKFKVRGCDGISRRQASRLLDVVIGRAKSHLATPGQVGYLIALGVDPATARGMGIKEASARIDELKR